MAKAEALHAFLADDPRLDGGAARRAVDGLVRWRRQQRRVDGVDDMTSGFVATPVVSNVNTATNPYSGSNADPRLVNAWGIAFNPQGFVWVANNGTSTSTLYDGAGVRNRSSCRFPPGQAGPAKPTGIVFNGSSAVRGEPGRRQRRERVHLRGRVGNDLRLVAEREHDERHRRRRRLRKGKIYKGLAISQRRRRAAPLRRRFPQRRGRRLRRQLRAGGGQRRVRRSDPSCRLRALRHPGDRQPDLRRATPSRTRKPKTTLPAAASARWMSSTRPATSCSV